MLRSALAVLLLAYLAILAWVHVKNRQPLPQPPESEIWIAAEPSLALDLALACVFVTPLVLVLALVIGVAWFLSRPTAKKHDSP